MWTFGIVSWSYWKTKLRVKKVEIIIELTKLRRIAENDGRREIKEIDVAA